MSSSADGVTTREIRTDYLARVEGEGAHVRAHPRRRGRGGAVQDLRAAALLRGAAPRPAVHRGARHHGADLRHLPDRLHRELVQRDGGRVRDRAARAGAAAAPARLLRRVDREPRAPHGDAPCARLPRLRRRRRAGPRPARPRRDGAAPEEGRQHGDGGRRRPRRAPGQPARRRHLPRALARGAAGARARARVGARRRDRADAPGSRASTSPTTSRTTRSSRCGSRASTRSSAAASSASTGLDIDVSEYEQHFTETHVERSNALHSTLAGVGSYLVGPLARYALNSHELSPLAREIAAEVGLGDRSCATRSAASSSARSRPSTPPTRRCGSSRSTSRPSRRSSKRCPAPAPATAAPRPRAGSAGTATRSTPTGTILDAKIVPPTSQNQKIDRGGPHRRRPPLARPRRRRARAPLRADDPELRPLHLLRDPLPEARGRARVRAAACLGSRYRGDDAVGPARRRPPPRRGRRRARLLRGPDPAPRSVGRARARRHRRRRPDGCGARHGAPDRRRRRSAATRPRARIDARVLRA